MSTYHRLLEQIGLQDSPQLRDLYESTLDVVVGKANAMIDDLVRARLLTDDFQYKNILAQGESTLDDLVDIIQDMK